MVNPGSGQNVDGSSNATVLNQDGNAGLARAYLETYQGPHGDAPEADSAVTAPVDKSVVGRLVSPAMLAAHGRLGKQRRIGETKVAVYGADDAAGFGPALQIGHRPERNADGLRHGIAASARRRLRRDHEPRVPGAPGPDVRAGRDAARGRPSRTPRRHRRDVDPRRAVAVGGRQDGGRGCRPAAQRARRRAPGGRRLGGTERHPGRPGRTRWTPTTPGHFPGYDRRDVAALLRWLADGHFVLLGYQRCGVHDGEASVDPASRLGVLRCAPTCFHS